ncbi:potassium transporter 1 [Brassica rapa]|uniref:potassium transporter 1 n=1 Tax=Brassica campestris TaxID=3711 RepID=UPI00142D877B|nr:potassium transporter 1 [Brassica rapa]XP_048628461.1 potassium transporter 1-like [Brassica napus]
MKNLQSFFFAPNHTPLFFLSFLRDSLTSLYSFPNFSLSLSLSLSLHIIIFSLFLQIFLQTENNTLLGAMNQSPSLIEQGISRQHLKKTVSCANVLTLAYQSLGVIYGDLSTSPLYVYKTTFSGKLSLHEDDEEIFGVFSFIFWTFTLIALFKYVFIVLSADDNGEGGTFALYSLLCRYAKLRVLPNHQEMDEKLSTYATGSPGETRQSAAVKSFFEKHPKSQKGLLIFVLLGTCMAIGDSVLTPTISVLSAVSGVKLKIPQLHENYVVIISCIILVAIFSVQRFGTHRVAFIFAPISTAWLLSISSIGVYNTIKWNPHIVSALSPVYMYKFLRNTGVEGWVSLGGVVLSITGVETMFADLGHFSSLSIKVAFSFFVYPCLILAYMGEAAFLSKHHEDIQRSFYKAIPEPVFWPVFIIATFAAVIGSQAVISATFSIISQCCALDCFPRVKIIHTSSKIHGQIYIPEVNWMLMCLCLAVTVGLRDTNMIGHAYGLAVTSVMLVTTCLMSLVMTIVWKQRTITVLAFLISFGSVELLYFSSCVYKIPEGGWIPILLSLTFMSVMYIWNYGTTKKHEFDVENKVSIDRIVALGPSIGMVRVPGIGLVYTNLVTGVPAVFGHFVTNLPAFHRVLVFVCVKSVQVPYVGEEERFVISRVGPKEYGMFRSVVRYGYRDVPREMYDFESRLVSAIVEFVETEPGTEGEEGCDSLRMRKEETLEIMEAKEAGVAYILGQSYAKAKQSSSVLKKLAVDVVFAFMSTNCRGTDVVLNVPHTSLLEVGMVYYV